MRGQLIHRGERVKRAPLEGPSFRFPLKPAKKRLIPSLRTPQSTRGGVPSFGLTARGLFPRELGPKHMQRLFVEVGADAEIVPVGRL